VFLLGNGLLGVFVRLLFLFGLAVGVSVMYIGYQGHDYLYLFFGGLVLWLVAMLWSYVIERDNKRRMNYPLHLE
jgi:hypothetical protein